MSAISDLTTDWSALSGSGIYTIPAASRLVAAHSSKVRSWIDSYANSSAEPIIEREFPNVAGKPVIGFIELIEAAFVRHFLLMGYSPQTIRKVAYKLRNRHSVKHPFAMEMSFRADGKKIFEETVDGDGERRLVDLMNDNFVMTEAVDQSLFDKILYVDDIAHQWSPLSDYPNIIVNPMIAFGKPVLLNSKIPTDVLARDVEVFGSVEEVAEEYETSIRDIKSAVEFEYELTSRTLL